LTFLLSDGETLWAYRDFNENYKRGDYTLKELEEYYTLNYAKGGFGFVVCSETLRMAELEWKGMVNGELIAVNRKGKMLVNEFL
jgi:predicted glutamine amidotransferase